MKKLAWRIVLGVVILLVIAIMIFSFCLDGIVKRGVETVGPTLTQTTLRLGGVSISLLGGSAKLKQLYVGNPTGYKSPSAIEADGVSLELSPASVLSDKIHIRSLVIDGPRVNVEGSPTDNNLTKILANIEAAAGTAPKAKSAGPEKKLQVDDFLIRNAQISLTLHMLGGKTVTVPLSEVHLTNLGQGPEGISAAELAKKIMTALTREISRVALTSVSGMGSSLGKGAADRIDKASRGFKDLFKKK